MKGAKIMDRERLIKILQEELLTQGIVRQQVFIAEIADKIIAELPPEPIYIYNYQDKIRHFEKCQCPICKGLNPEAPPKNKIEPLELIHSADGYWYAKDKNTEAIYCALMFIEKKINELIADRNKQ